MKILDNLKRVFESSFRDVFTNNIFKLFDFSRSTNVFLEKDGERLLINLKEADENQKQQVKKILDESREDDEEGFLTNAVVKKTYQIKRNLPEKNDEKLLEFYKDKISLGVYSALELAIVVRSSFKKGEDISELKKDISYKFPDFGNNVCNLVSSDYFEYYFKELYDIRLEEVDFNIDDYKKEVGRIVRELPYMVFINRYKSLEEFEGEVKFKLSKLKKYGTDKLKLHVIGRENVEKALKIAKNYDEDEDINIERELNKNNTIVTITFNF